MKPLYSIVIPTYNSVKYAPETVRSALEQSYSNVEVIVDDNTSRDQTLEVLGQTFGDHPRLHLFDNEEDLNIPRGWNRGLSRAQGEFVLLLHSDNLLHPQYVETVVAQMEEFKAKVAYSECAYFEGDTPTKLFKPLNPSLAVEYDYLSPGPRAVAYVFRFQRMIPTSCLTIRRSCLENRQAFDPQYQWDPDMDLLVRLVHDFGVLRLNESLAAIRTHPDQAPNWRDKTFSTQYEQLLRKQHEVGLTEGHHFLMERASSNEDITRRLSGLGVPSRAFLSYWFRWLRSELRVFRHFSVHFLRKFKSLTLAYYRWWVSKKKLA